MSACKEHIVNLVKDMWSPEIADASYSFKTEYWDCKVKFCLSFASTGDASMVKVCSSHASAD